jgi:tRNA dimethylallyltransferase
VFEATGTTLAQWQVHHRPCPLLAPGAWRGVFLAPARETLYARIDRRFEQMIAAGVLDEVAALRARGLPANRGVMKAHGVPHLMRHLAGESTLEEAIRLGQQDTRNYAKRQFTWARKFMAGWTWCEGADEALRALEHPSTGSG